MHSRFSTGRLLAIEDFTFTVNERTKFNLQLIDELNFIPNLYIINRNKCKKICTCACLVRDFKICFILIIILIIIINYVIMNSATIDIMLDISEVILKSMLRTMVPLH